LVIEYDRARPLGLVKAVAGMRQLLLAPALNQIVPMPPL
jgi:hypothetical protein